MLAATVRPAEMCGGTVKSSCSPASERRLRNPETSSVLSIIAKMRNSRLLAETTAEMPTSRTAKVKSSPPRVILYFTRRKMAPRNCFSRTRIRYLWHNRGFHVDPIAKGVIAARAWPVGAGVLRHCDGAAHRAHAAIWRGEPGGPRARGHVHPDRDVRHAADGGQLWPHGARVS